MPGTCHKLFAVAHLDRTDRGDVRIDGTAVSDLQTEGDERNVGE